MYPTASSLVSNYFMSDNEPPGPVVAAKSATVNAVETPASAHADVRLEPSDLVAACQAGDLDRVQAILSSGAVSADTIEADGTTALHWAAINNRLSICKYLLEHGAKVDAKGGELNATPLHWASKYGLVYITHLLIEHGADPLVSDNQGFNALHLATHSSNVLLLIYLLHQEIPVDITDSSGRTALHWAAYQGDALSVDVLLKWGADVHSRDSTGFIPLHWAIVKGSLLCVQRLLEEGSDPNAALEDGKTPAIMAEEMNTTSIWHSALAEVGRDKNGSLRPIYLSKKNTDLIIFFSPFFVLPVLWTIFGNMPWFASIIFIALLMVLYLKLLNLYVVPNAYFGNQVALRTPFFAGIFFCSALWVWIRYLLFIGPVTLTASPFCNLVFVFLFAAVTLTFLAAMLMDPGYIPKATGITEQRNVIESLIDSGDFDSSHFCLATFVRKPVRSKYDRNSQRVVAKFDHACPWVNNVVGARNERYFAIFILSLLFGIPLLEYLFFVEAVPAAIDNGAIRALPMDGDNFAFLPEIARSAFAYFPFTTSLCLWCLVQFIWVILLVFVQLVQISRGMTTSEAISLNRYGNLTSDTFSSLPKDHHTNHKLMLDKFAADAVKPRRSPCGSLFRLIGLSMFVSTASSTLGRSHREKRNKNPADYGIVQNCIDFWMPAGNKNLFKPAAEPLGALGGRSVDYSTLWDYPINQKTDHSHDYEMV